MGGIGSGSFSWVEGLPGSPARGDERCLPASTRGGTVHDASARYSGPFPWDGIVPGGPGPPGTGRSAGAAGLSAGQPTSGIEHGDLVELAPMLRRVIAARVHEVD